MGWGSWMVPDLSDSQEFALRVLEFELRDEIKQNPARVIELCVSLSRVSQMQNSIINKATKRIAELEVQQAVREQRVTRPWWMRWSPMKTLGRICGND